MSILHYFGSGGTLNAGLWRVTGTIIGGLFGWAALESDNGSAYVLALFAVLLGKFIAFIIPINAL